MGTAFLEAKPCPSVFTELNLLPGLFGNVCDQIQTVKNSQRLSKQWGTKKRAVKLPEASVPRSTS